MISALLSSSSGLAVLTLAENPAAAGP